jgi:hypothetical protein
VITVIVLQIVHILRTDKRAHDSNVWHATVFRINVSLFGAREISGVDEDARLQAPQDRCVTLKFFLRTL